MGRQRARAFLMKPTSEFQSHTGIEFYLNATLPYLGQYYHQLCLQKLWKGANLD